MAVTISPGWGNMSWAQDLREEAGLFGSNKFQARARRFREEATTTPAPAKSPVDYNAGGVAGGFADLSGTAYSPDYDSPAYDRAKDALYSGVKDVGIKSLTNAGTYSLASTLANSFSPSTALGVALNPSNLASAAPALAGNVLSSAMGLQPNNLTTGVRAVGSALSFVNPAIGLLSGVLAPQIAESIGKVFGTRTDEKMKQAVEDATGKNYFGAAALTSDLNSHARMAPNIPDTFTDVDGYRQTMGLSPDEARANAIGSAAALSRYSVDARQDAYSKDFSDYGRFDTANDALSRAALGQMQASLVGAPVEQTYAYASPFADLSAINNYHNLADPTGAATGWNGNVHSINNTDTPAARAMASQMGNRVTPANIAAVNSAAMGVPNLGDVTGYVRDHRVQGAINRALAAAKAVEAVSPDDDDSRTANNAAASVTGTTTDTNSGNSESSTTTAADARGGRSKDGMGGFGRASGALGGDHNSAGNTGGDKGGPSGTGSHAA